MQNSSTDYKLLETTENMELIWELYGPVQTPFEGGTFRIRMIFPEEFPQLPPKGYFLTKIYHPNISDKGDICVNSLKKDWNPANWSL